MQQATIRTYGAQMPVVMTLTILSSGAVLILLWKRRSAARWLSLMSLLCLVVILLITLAGELPLNRQMLTWSSAPPANWAALRDRWELYHTLRAALSVVALGGQLLAVLQASLPT